MARIKIPEQVFAGFKLIGSLSDEQIVELVNFLTSLEVGRDYSEVAQELSEKLNLDGDDLLQTILSFHKLVDKGEVPLAELSNNLAQSYSELSKAGLKTKELNKLKANLLSILTNFGIIKINQRIQKYRVENSNNLNDFKLFTDVRIIDPYEDSKDEVYGVILHQIYLNFQNDKPNDEIHIHTGLDSLIQLKAEIEKAIERDEMIRKKYSGNLKLI